MPNGAPGGTPQVVIPGTGWVDLASRVVVQVGFPVVVAGVLLWFFLGTFQHSMASTAVQLNANAELAGKLLAQAAEQYREVTAQSIELRRQSSHLRRQTELMAAIQRDAESLLQLRNEELGLFKDIRAMMAERRPKEAK